jgi:hypothetical protein
MSTAAALVEASDKSAMTQLRLVVTATLATAKFLSIPVISQVHRRRRTNKNAKVPVGGAMTPASLTLHAAPPMDDDEYNNEDDVGMIDEEHRKDCHDDDDNARPGPFLIAGIDSRQISQQTFLYYDQGVADEEEKKENSDNATILNRNDVLGFYHVVPDAPHQQLIQQLIFIHGLEPMMNNLYLLLLLLLLHLGD